MINFIKGLFTYKTKVCTKKKKSKPFKKKEDGFNTITGYYDKEHLKIKFLIRQIAQLNHKVAYVGATSNIKQRWENYKKWKFRHVLYETTSFEMAKLAETQLIKYTNNKISICNECPHSKGLKDGKEKYYIYLLADNACQARA